MDTETGVQKRPGPAPLKGASYHLKSFNTTMNMLSHVLIGVIVGVNIVYVFRQPLPLNNTNIHIVLCVLGYQLLMAEAILSLSPYNGWSEHMRLVDKKRVHTILQIAGSALAIAGTFVMTASKARNPNQRNWDSPHGITALIAVVFTIASLVNGLTALYGYELRKCIPDKLSKISHICFGIIAFALANISLCYGFEKNGFRNWVGGTNSDPIVNTLIAFTAILTASMIVAPLITFYNKLKTN